MRKWFSVATISLCIVVLTLVVRPSSAQIVKLESSPSTYRYYETPLKADGMAYEIHPDSAGNIWVSDTTGEEIRRYSVDGAQMDIYKLNYHLPADARADAGGIIWFVDQYGSDYLIGRLDPTSGGGTYVTVDYWEPGVSIWGIALDGYGQVWFSGVASGTIHYLNLDDPMHQLHCSLTLSQGNTGYYIIYEGGYIWMAESYGNRLLRLDSKYFNLTTWTLPSTEWDFEVKHLVGDGAGGIWFSDESQKTIGHLDLVDPDHPALLRFDRPVPPHLPNMLSASLDRLWFSDTGTPGVNGSVGGMSFSNPPSATFSPMVAEFPLVPACDPITPVLETPFEKISNTPAWTEVPYSADESLKDWLQVSLPDGSHPWGTAWDGRNLWVADQGRQVLLRMDTAPVETIFLPLIQR